MKKKLLVVAYLILCSVSLSVQASTVPNFSTQLLSLIQDHELIKTCQALSDEGLTTEQVVDLVVKSDQQSAYSRWLAELENEEDFDKEQSIILCPCSVEMLTVAAVLLAYGVHVIYCWDWDF